MIGESHLCQVLQSQEIDTSFIDHSLSYRENCNNLYHQFGVKFNADYNYKQYRRYDEMEKQLSREEMLANMTLPFDPVARAKLVESIVMDELGRRSYYRVRFAERFDCPVTIDSTGCCLSCAFCWNASRNEKIQLGKFFSPKEIAAKAIEVAKKEGVWRFRISGCETILGKASARHFCQVIDAVRNAQGGHKAFFLLETNGIVLGHDKSIVEKLSRHKDHLAVRVSIKGDSPAQYEKLSGAIESSYKYQKLALDYCYEFGIPSLPAIMSTFMDLKKVSQYLKIHPDDIDQEALKYYPITKKSLIDRGCWDLRIVKEKPEKKAKKPSP